MFIVYFLILYTVVKTSYILSIPKTTTVRTTLIIAEKKKLELKHIRLTFNLAWVGGQYYIVSSHFTTHPYIILNFTS